MSLDPYDLAPDIEPSALLQVYLDVFGSANGRLVLRDMVNAYHHRMQASLEQDVANIDHPYRAYYIDGQRSVVLQLVELLKEARRAQYAVPDISQGDG